MEDSVGNIVYDFISISRIILDHFHTIFGINSNPSSVAHTSTTAPIFIPSAKQIKKAVFSLSPHKAPGPDGFHAFFFQKFWNELEPLITYHVWDFFKNGNLPQTVFHTNIALIPKCPNPSLPSHYRPIGLCNSIYKIISKTIVMHLQPLLPSLISPFQNSFLKGRGPSINYKRKGRRGYFALKLDIHKAFDSLNWTFIHNCLSDLIPDTGLVKLIMTCITNTSYSLLINGQPTPPFHPLRGIRQGDPLSP